MYKGNDMIMLCYLDYVMHQLPIHNMKNSYDSDQVTEDVLS